jgi:hypothetical protein
MNLHSSLSQLCRYGIVSGRKTLIDSLSACIWWLMRPVYAPCIALQDRARLRERFYGAARTVLARL